MMKKNLIIPEGYSPSLDIRETEKAIKFIKNRFQDELVLPKETSYRRSTVQSMAC